ncbi:MAG: AMP-binding protein [Labilithrix sp.]|nr:AMP-binding protein [Labilithrix sp.]
MNAAGWLLEGSERRPDAPAFAQQGKHLSHGEWRARVLAVAACLRARGVAPGDRVASISPNTPDAAAALVGALLAGATAVPLPASDPAPRLARMLARAKPVAIFAEARAATTAAELCPSAFVYGKAELDATAPSYAPAAETAPSDPALVLFTSGSTGEPRGVVLSHENIVANTSSILASLPIRETDRMMAVLPFYYSFGASVLFTHVRAGASVVMNNQFMFADRVLEEMQREECTSFAGVPSTYQLLLRRSSLATMTFPRLRYVQQAGGRLPPNFVRELEERLPGTEIWLMYGQTEATARLSCLDPRHLADKAHTIGKPIAGVTLELVGPDGAPVPRGEVGELVARGKNVALGYLDEPEATAETFRDGALYTGDLGKVDDDGFFVLVDRAKDFLKCAGYRVAMKEIEDVLAAFDGMVEAAVVGIPDDLQGEAVQAFVVHGRGEAARPDLETYCKRALLPHVQPRVTVFVDALPKTAAGKLARATLRELARSDRTG